MKSKRYIVLLLFLGVFLCILGIGLIIPASLSLAKCEKQTGSNHPTIEERSEDRQCAPSDDAIRVQLHGTIERVMNAYFSLYPNKIIWHPTAEGEELKKFRPYNCSPQALKRRTDTARTLYQEVAKLKQSINQTLLKPRELKSLLQLLHYLKTNFGYPYGENYYAGDWMMGPSRFCAESICIIGHELYYNFNNRPWSWQPKTLEDVDYVIEQLQAHRSLIEQYIINIRYGIAAGMVRSSVECEAGYYSFTRNFFKVYTLGSKGILHEWFTEGLMHEEFLSKLEKGVENKWQAKIGRNVRESINLTLVEYLGKPLNDLLHFLEHEYRLHCVSSNISSGLATLPLEYVYFNGSRTSNRTTKRLPFGENVRGKKAYESILYYFTSSDLTPDAIYKMGKERLDALYSEAVKIAMNYTGKNVDEAIGLYKQMLSNQSNFFNDAPFPANESGDDAFRNCNGLVDARMFCPKRYKAFEKWSSFVREILGNLEPRTIKMFHFTGDKRTTPNCPVQVVPNFNPKTGSQSYISSGPDCRNPCRYRLPFFMDNMGPKYNAFSVAAHEGRPGHHTQVQGKAENFNDICSDEITWLERQVHYPYFSEGWALYAENPLLPQGTDIYDENQVQKYGMLKWQIWRALRLVIDTGLHYKGMKRSEALIYLADYAWDTTDKAKKDVTRYQSNPGQATAYMIGQLEIWRLRNLTKEKLEAANKSFNEKDFHYQILKNGRSPLEYLKIHINKYIECVISNSENCDLLGEESSRDSNGELLTEMGIHKKMLPVLYRPWHEHFD